MPWCEKHNREKLLSKYPNKKTGGKDYWCPECYDEYKLTHPKKTEANSSVEEALTMDSMDKKLDLLIEAVKIINSNIKGLVAFLQPTKQFKLPKKEIPVVEEPETDEAGNLL